VIKDPETYERFEKVVLLQRLPPRRRTGLGEMITEKLPNDELIGELVRNQLILLSDRDARFRSATAAGSPT